MSGADQGSVEQAKVITTDAITTLLDRARQLLRHLQCQSDVGDSSEKNGSPYRAELARELTQVIDDAAHAAIEEQRALRDCAREVREDAEARLAAERWLERLQARVRMAYLNASAEEQRDLELRFARCTVNDRTRTHEVLHALRTALAELEDTGKSQPATQLADPEFVRLGAECERTLTRERRETSAARGRRRAMNRDLGRGERRLREILGEQRAS